MKVLSLFDGLSGGRIALDRLGFEVDEYYASEIDKYAIQVAKDNWPLTKHIGSVVDIDTDDLPIIDLLVGGSPCQGFSFAGKRKGSATKEGIDVTSLSQYIDLKEQGFEFDGQSYLFWEYMRILTALRKKNPNIKFMLENVMMTKKWKTMFDKAVGIDSIEINSSLMSAQNRKRLYWTNIIVDGQPQDKGISLNSIFGENPLVHNLYGGFNETKPRVFLDKSPTIRAASGGGAIPSVMFDGKFKDDMTLEYAKTNSRTISPEECEQLQTLPIGYTKSVSDTQRRKMIGNGWTIDVICHLLKNYKEKSYSPPETIKVSDILF